MFTLTAPAIVFLAVASRFTCDAYGLWSFYTNQRDDAPVKVGEGFDANNFPIPFEGRKYSKRFKPSYVLMKRDEFDFDDPRFFSTSFG
ncbi:hypothetical protein L596_019467 [Steinernema carpocapsae]|uniref:Uncharacterized protein n=1 Tax=Steinernema carpocapsae TaxID=34508 RepID=A0A4U5MQL5_STECR|nr:hypothetical protein L596_019467 [Steinernema carpocapsae]